MAAPDAGDFQSKTRGILGTSKVTLNCQTELLFVIFRNFGKKPSLRYWMLKTLGSVLMQAQSHNDILMIMMLLRSG